MVRVSVAEITKGASLRGCGSAATLQKVLQRWASQPVGGGTQYAAQVVKRHVIVNHTGQRLVPECPAT